MPVGGSPSFVATGPINIASFVTNDPRVPYAVVQCANASQRPIGVSQQGIGTPPGVIGSGTAATGSTAPTPTAPQPIMVWGPGDVCRIQLAASAGTINNGDLLVAAGDGTGQAVLASYASPNQWYGAIALTSGTAGQLIRALVTGPIPYGVATSGASL